jgi:anti-sigma B factor antagonist
VSRLEFERVDGVPVARPSEDIDAANARVLRDELAASLQGADTLVLDLSATRYVDSAGIDMLFRLNELLRQRRAKLLLVIPQSSQLTRLAQIVALPSAVAIHETVEQALGAVSPQCGG